MLSCVCIQLVSGCDSWPSLGQLGYITTKISKSDCSQPEAYGWDVRSIAFIRLEGPQVLSVLEALFQSWRIEEVDAYST